MAPRRRSEGRSAWYAVPLPHSQRHDDDSSPEEARPCRKDRRIDAREVKAEANYLWNSLVCRSMIGHQEILARTRERDVNRPGPRTSQRPQTSDIYSCPVGRILRLVQDEQVHGTPGRFHVVAAEVAPSEDVELVVHVPDGPGGDRRRGGGIGSEGGNDE